jgi:hypothetical protein
MRVLEQLPAIPKRFDFDAFIQRYVFGVALGTRTKFCDIKILRDGQFLDCTEGNPKIGYYFRWDHIEPSDSDLEHIKKKCYDAFKTAVSIRASREAKQFALLSGGLDSRAVVSILNHLGKNVTAFNFSNPGEKDEAYGRQYAETLNLNYFSETRPLGKWSMGHLIARKIEGLEPAVLEGKRYPRLVFSGDGGSVGMGHVYMNETLVEKRRQEGIEAAMAHFLSKRSLPDRVFTKEAKAFIKHAPFNGLKQEINDLGSVLPGRDFYLFLLKNDQRRHLHGYWESIDQSGVEFLEPLYDARLLSVVASAPVDPFIGHRFYYDWLDLFPNDAKSVPWQAYPGHLPCPLEKSDQFVNQWENYRKIKKKAGNQSVIDLTRILFKKDFPSVLLSRYMIGAAMAVHMLKLRDVTYLFEIAKSVYNDHRNCENTRVGSCV